MPSKRSLALGVLLGTALAGALYLRVADDQSTYDLEDPTAEDESTVDQRTQDAADDAATT